VSSIRATHIPVQIALKSASLPILMLTLLKNKAHTKGRFISSISFFLSSGFIFSINFFDMPVTYSPSFTRKRE
jgi:hypothetical protein